MITLENGFVFLFNLIETEMKFSKPKTNWNGPLGARIVFCLYYYKLYFDTTDIISNEHSTTFKDFERFSWAIKSTDKSCSCSMTANV